MRKIFENSNLDGRPAARAILALTLVMALAAFGCTTNRMPGNGDPVTGSPGSTAAPTSATPGSSSGSTTPPPMTSSYRGAPLHTPDDAAAIIAAQRRVVVLGPSFPGPVDHAYVSDGRTNQYVNPAQQMGRYTINSSIFSPSPGAAITSGAGVDATIADAAAVFPATDAIVTPTNATVGTTVTAAAGTTTAAGGTIPAATATGTVAGTAIGAAVTPTTSALSVSPTVAASSTVRVTSVDGRVTVTNVGTARSQ